jgi:hypothetical protein
MRLDGWLVVSFIVQHWYLVDYGCDESRVTSEFFAAYFKVLPCRLPGYIEENHEIPYISFSPVKTSRLSVAPILLTCYFGDALLGVLY